MKLKLATACLVAALTQAPHALAQTTGTVTYFGVVANTQTFYFGDETVTEPAPDYDVADLFGGGNLEGDFVTATFTYSSAYGIESSDPGDYDELDGGSSYPVSNPLLSATFSVEQPTTLNVYNYTFTPGYYSDVYTSSSYIDDIGASTAGDDIYAYIEPALGDGPTSLAQSYVGDGYGGGSYFDPAGTNTGLQDAIVFDVLQVSVTASAAPEPSTWALMIAGIGAVGFGLRYRRSRQSEGAKLAA